MLDRVMHNSWLRDGRSFTAEDVCKSTRQGITGGDA